MCKFKNFTATQIFCEINFSKSKFSKMAILIILQALDLEFRKFQPIKFAKLSESPKNVKMAKLEPLELTRLIAWKFLSGR